MYKKFFFFLLTLGLLCLPAAIPAEAAFVTAYENIVYLKYVVDTSSIYVISDKRFNVIAYKYESEQDPGKAYLFKFQFDEADMKWKVHANGRWEIIEAGSVAADILKVCLPYIQ